VNEFVSEITSDLVDLTDVDLAQFQAALSETGRGNSALALSLRRVMREARNPASAIAGFQSTL
jgi:FXSXX-COOH protein